MSKPKQTEVAGFTGIEAQGLGSSGNPPLLFLHGAFGDHSSFENFVRYFSDEGYDCYALSRRGRHGVSPKDLSGVSVEDYYQDVEKMVAAIKEKPILLGHSLGGLLTLRIAEDRKCSAAVLLASAPPGMWIPPVGSLPKLMPYMGTMMRGKAFLMSDEGFGSLALNCVPEDQRKVVTDMFVPESGLILRELMFGAIRVEVKKVEVPVLCVGALDDRLMAKRTIRSTARRFGAELQEHPGHGHFFVQEPGWEKIAQGILRWLQTAVPTKQTVTS